MQTVRIAGITALAGLIFRMFMPWWSIVLGGLVAGAVYPKSTKACFGGGFIGAAILWGGYAAFINVQNNGLLAGKMGQLFGGVPAWAMILITAITGGIYGGLGAWLGSAVRNSFWPSKQ